MEYLFARVNSVYHLLTCVRILESADPINNGVSNLLIFLSKLHNAAGKGVFLVYIDIGRLNTPWKCLRFGEVYLCKHQM